MKIFLAYPSERQSDAVQVYKTLANIPGITVWFDKVSLVGGQDWDRERKNAQASADLRVHLISDVISSRHGVVNREIRESLEIARDAPLGRISLVFIRLDDFPVPSEVAQFQYIDYFKEDWADRIATTIAHAFPSNNFTSKSVHSSSNTVSQDVIEFDDIRKIDLYENSVNFETSVKYFEIKDVSRYYDYVNSTISESALSEFYWARRNYTKGFNPAYIDSLHDVVFDVFYRVGDLISIRCQATTYSAGAAHPNHWQRSYNLLGDNIGRIEVAEFFGDDTESGYKLIKACMAKIAKDSIDDVFDGESDEIFYLEDSELRDDPFHYLSCFFFSKTGIHFTFSPYLIAPYVAGVLEASLSYQEIEDLVSMEAMTFVRFVKRQIFGQSDLSS